MSALDRPVRVPDGSCVACIDKPAEVRPSDVLAALDDEQWDEITEGLFRCPICERIQRVAERQRRGVCKRCVEDSEATT